MVQPDRVRASDHFLISTGALSLNWAAMESGLDYIVAMLFHEFGGKEHERDIPRSLTRKLDFTKRCLRAPQLTPYVDELRGLLARIRDLKTARDGAIHGSMTGWGPGEQATMVRITYSAHSHHAEDVIVTTAQVCSAADAAHILADDVIGLAERLFEVVIKARGDDPVGDSTG